MKNGLHNQLGRGFLFAALLGGAIAPSMASAIEAAPSVTVSDLVQTKTVTGKVVDQKGQPVVGATVIVQNTSRGDITSAEGTFSIDGVKVGDNLEVAFIGYVTKFVPVGTETNITVTLEEDALKVEDVVVVGFGQQKKVNLTGAVAAVDSEELLKRPVADVQQMLQGAVPGLNIVTTTGLPGAESVSMNIRGGNTFNSNAVTSPLVLIDGVEGYLTTLDPNQIESVSVLKDAASASIYGSRAANGVILVTTKKGTGTREKVSITYNMNIGFHAPTRLLDLVSDPVEYMNLKNTAMTNSKEVDRPLYSNADIALYENETDKKNGKFSGFDWQKYAFKTAIVQNHNIGIAGTSGNTSYNINLSYMNQDGTMRTNYYYKRFNVSSNVQSQIKPWLKIGANIALMHNDRNSLDSEDDYLSTLAQAPTYKPWLVDKFGPNGETLWTGYAFDNEWKHFGSNRNIFASNQEFYSFDKRKNYDVNAQMYFDANIVKGLTWHTKAAIRYGNSTRKRWGNPNRIPYYNYLTGELANKGESTTVPYKTSQGVYSSSATSLYTNLYTYLNYEYSSKNEAHNFSIMAGYSQEQYDTRDVSASRRNYDFPLYEVSAGTNDADKTATGTSSSWALMSAFGRVNYNFKERYLVEANIRYDGTSRLASESRWGVFPSFSAGWRLTQEQFMKDLNLSWLNNVKFRGSWGLLGNQNIGNYLYQPTVALGYNYSFDKVDISSGVAQTSAVNRNLKWETTAIGDFGFDIQLFRGLNITFDWYKKRTYDIIRTAQATNLLGLTAPYINDGEMVNKGVEFMIGWSDRIRDGVFKDFGYNVNFFITKNENELVKYGSVTYSSINDYVGSNYYLISEEGGPRYQYYMYEALGIYESNAQVASTEYNGYKIAPYNSSVQEGDIIYHDVNGDGKINNEDRVKFDGFYEKFSYTVNLGFDWKGFDLSMMLQGRAGLKTFDRGYMGFGTIPFTQGSAPRTSYIEGMWTPENNVGAKHPRLYYGDMGGTKNLVNSSYYLKKSGFMRLKNLTVGYTIPKNITQKIGVQKFRVYFSGDNLATATKFDGLDPERSGGSYGVSYPVSRVCSFGVNLQF